MTPLRQAVVAVLRDTGLRFEVRAVLRDGGWYSVDVLPEGRRVAVDVHGPRAYAQGSDGYQMTGTVLLKQRQLRALGYTLVPVPFYAWEQLPQEAQKRSYLQGLLVD